MWKRICGLCLTLATCFTLLVGCGASAPLSADLSFTQAHIGTISIPTDVKVVGLGEAGHGVAEYQQMKADVFRALVENAGCHTFIIEGDFGGALKVDNYINGGDGTAEEIVGEIGFAIYKTQEMVDLISWMRSYNEHALPEEALHFFGMDVQRLDNNKEYLFSILDQCVPDLRKKYEKSLAKLTDENRESVNTDDLTHGKNEISKLIAEMDLMKKTIVEQSGESAFDYARECASTIYACCDLLLSNDYNATRDKYMFEKIEWFLSHGDGSLLFINGHNGHIAKTSVAGYTCLGDLLSKNLGDGYYSIGTDAQKTLFNSQKDNGEFETMEVNNTNELNSQLEHSNMDYYFIDFDNVESNDMWQQISSGEQVITTLNVSLVGWQKLMKSMYTTEIVPKDTFDGMIIFKSVSPTTLLQ